MKRTLEFLFIGLALSACTNHISDSDLDDSDGDMGQSGNPDMAQSGPATLHLVAGAAGASGNIDGNGKIARLNWPSTAIADTLGNLYIVDAYNCAIRKQVLKTGDVTTFAGKAGSCGSGDGIGSAARFKTLEGAVGDGIGSLYVADAGNHTIRRVSLNTGEVTTIAGGSGSSGSSDGTGIAARFAQPTGLALDGSSILYVADAGNHNVRQIVLATGEVTTLVGSAGTTGSADGVGSAALFDEPEGLVSDQKGNLYVADSNNHTIRQIVIASATVSTIAGSAGTLGYVDGGGSSARFNVPYGLGGDRAGNLYIADSMNCRIRKLAITSREVTTLAGQGCEIYSSDGVGTSAHLSRPRGVSFDGTGTLYVADTLNDSVARLVLSTGAVTTIAGSGEASRTVDGMGAAAMFSNPNSAAADGAGNLYVAETNGHVVRKIALATGEVTTLAGSGSTGTRDGVGTAAQFSLPQGIAADRAGNLFVTDISSNTIRKIVIQSGAVTTFAGTNNVRGSSDGVGTSATFNGPIGIAADGQGNLYVADTNNHTIRKIVIQSGAVTTLIGLAGVYGSTDGVGSVARLRNPWAVASDGAGNLYIADTNNNLIRQMDAKSGMVTTLAGTAGPSDHIDGAGPAARFFGPSGITVDDGGNVYVADSGNSSVRMITRGNANVTTLVGLYGQKGIVLGALPGRLNEPEGVTWASGRLYIVDRAESVVLGVY